jgi:hypothetical protein
MTLQLPALNQGPQQIAEAVLWNTQILKKQFLMLQNRGAPLGRLGGWILERR